MPSDSMDACTNVSDLCPVAATTYGYVPNFGANLFFLLAFSLLSLAQITLCLLYRMPTFFLAAGVGTLFEALGYGGRLILHANVWSPVGFKMQICCLILAPSFLAAGIYLSIKHLAIAFGAQHSRIKPRLYPWLFVGADCVSIVLQAVGGGVAASGDGGGKSVDWKLIKGGNNLMVAGICFQVLSMTVLAVLAVDFFVRAQRSNEGLASGAMDRRLRVFCGALVVVFITIYTRCVYRIPEMVGGWGNPLMRREGEFIALDSTMILIACICLAVFHPGYWFPPMAGRGRKEGKSGGSESPSVSEKEGGDASS